MDELVKETQKGIYKISVYSPKEKISFINYMIKYDLKICLLKDYHSINLLPKK